jgi:hypothetical protein
MGTASRKIARRRDPVVKSCSEPTMASFRSLSRAFIVALSISIKRRHRVVGGHYPYPVGSKVATAILAQYAMGHVAAVF